MSDNKFDIPFKSPLVPERMGLEDKFRFRCYKGISCFNACCKMADVTLTPYDIIRLKNRLGMDSSEFLKTYTRPESMDAHKLPAIKMRTLENEPMCVFMKEGEGCKVYEDRPSVCRYYPVGLMNMRAPGSATDEQHYFMVKEDHCRGHEQDNAITIGQYRKEQGVEEYDELNHEWYQIILKKRSSGPTIGKPSDMSLQLFFMCSYDVDRFRRFVISDSFKNSYEMEDSFYAQVETDDIALMKFGFRLMKQVLFGEVTIPESEGAYQKRLQERKDIIEMRREIALAEHEASSPMYDGASDETDAEPKKN